MPHRKKDSEEMGGCLPGPIRRHREHAVCCIIMLIIIMLRGSRHVDHLAGWRSCAPVTLTAPGSNHTGLLAGGAPPYWQGFTRTLRCCCNAPGQQVHRSIAWLGSFMLAGPYQVSGMHVNLSVTLKPHTTARVQPLANL